MLVATLLRARGFESLTAVEAGMLGRDDADQLEFAAQHQRAFLTHNRIDFEDLVQSYYAAGRPHEGVIIAVRRPPHEIAARLLRILTK